jgi:hypothetical protein
MAATGAATARHECVPARAAAVGEEFRISTRYAKPAMRWLRAPLAARTADPAEVGIFFGPSYRRTAHFFDLRFILQQQKDDLEGALSMPSGGERSWDFF